jgi:hypothetical protein
MPRPEDGVTDPKTRKILEQTLAIAEETPDPKERGFSQKSAGMPPG